MDSMVYWFLIFGVRNTDTYFFNVWAYGVFGVWRWGGEERVLPSDESV